MFIRKAIFALIIIFILASCEEETITDSRFAMDTLVTVTLYESDEEYMDDIFSCIYELDDAISRYRDGSYIDRINKSAGREPVTVPEDIYELIKAAYDMAEDTDGVFNPAIGPLTDLWGMGGENARVPDRNEIERVLPLLDWRCIKLSDEDRSVFLEKEGMSLDLGAVGKGWSADMLRARLSSLGIDHALVNLGGNVLAYGGKKGREGWRIGIRDPENPSAVFYTLEIDDGTVITSGGYQRYIEKDGRIYHHILSAETGYPFETDILSATVIGESGTLGDMLSTVLFAEGSEEARKRAEEYDVRAILKLEDGSVIDTGEAESEIAIAEK